MGRKISSHDHFGVSSVIMSVWDKESFDSKIADEVYLYVPKLQNQYNTGSNLLKLNVLKDPRFE